MKYCIYILLSFLPTLSFASRVKTLHLKENTIPTVQISHRGAVLNFPSKPTKVIMGNKGAFAIEYINNDLAISPLHISARAHLFVYLEGRRFNLDLMTNSKGHSLVQIRDKIEKSVEPPYVRK